MESTVQIEEGVESEGGRRQFPPRMEFAMGGMIRGGFVAVAGPTWRLKCMVPNPDDGNWTHTVQFVASSIVLFNR